jgi:hypothetical protein
VQAILDTLLAVPFPGRDDVARQVEVARGRRLDDDGCLELSAQAVPPAAVVRSIPVEAEIDDADGVTIHILLHVVDGYIDELEFYRDDGSPQQGSILPEALRVIVL